MEYVRFEQYLISLIPSRHGKVTVSVEVSNLGYSTFLSFPDGSSYLVRMSVGPDRIGISEVTPWNLPVPQPAIPQGEIAMHDDIRAAVGPHICAHLDAAAPGWLAKLIDALPQLIAILMPIFLQPPPAK